jgi:hypothetical protein
VAEYRENHSLEALPVERLDVDQRGNEKRGKVFKLHVADEIEHIHLLFIDKERHFEVFIIQRLYVEVQIHLFLLQGEKNK